MADNLRKLRNSWGRMSQILSREGAYPKVSEHFFKAEVQAVLLFGAETCVLTPRMERDLSSFQHRVELRLTGRQPRRQWDGSWDHPMLAEEMAEAGFEDIGTYVTRRQHTVAQYIVTQTILDLCERSARRPVAWVYCQWWDQEGLDLEGAK